jgi:hypothetical protein
MCSILHGVLIKIQEAHIEIVGVLLFTLKYLIYQISALVAL